MRSPKSTLTEQELEIMKIIWELQASTVRQVYEAMRERRQIAYTTVMTMMNILEEKGHLKKRAKDRAFVYQPRQPREEVIGGMVRDFVNRVFNGSAEPLLMHLVADQKVTEKELDELRKMIRGGVKAERGRL
jgi:predicted transcriptional regulator